jgi:glycosyltransferase involved in cell wall biosynthesis
MLVPPGDPAALAAALVRLAQNPEARAAMGRAGAARAAAFAPAAVAAAMAAVYAEAIAARR